MALESPDSQETREILRYFCHENDSQGQLFTSFYRFYEKVISGWFNPGHPVISPGGSIPLGSHPHVRTIIDHISTNCQKSRSELMSEVFSYSDSPEEERRQAIRAAVKVGFMFDCASVDTFSSQFKILSNDSFPTEWRREQSFLETVRAAFPSDLTSPYRASRKDRALKAWKLRKRHGIQLVPTEDLVQHLYYDQKTNTLSIFHQVAWLKAQVRHTRHNDLAEPLEASVRNGTLPPQLLLETLYTIYRILLPLDKKSAKYARKLVAGGKGKAIEFDPDILTDNGLIREVPDPLELVYWNNRLSAIREIVKNPPPTNALTAWFERHTNERNALTVAIIGLFLAVLFGFLSFIVGVAQLVVSILAWKYPNPN